MRSYYSQIKKKSEADFLFFRFAVLLPKILEFIWCLFGVYFYKI